MATFDKSKFKTTKVDGVLSVVYDDENAFKDGTEIPFKTLKEVSDYQHQYVLDATTAAVDFAKEKMKKEKDIKQSTVKFPFSTSTKGKIEVVVDREKTFNNALKGKGETVTRPAISVKVTNPAVTLPKPKIKSMVDDLIVAFGK